MAALSTLLAILSLDDSPFLAGLNSAEKASDTFTGKLSKVGGAIAGTALTVAGAGIAAVGGFIASSIGPASDLEESMNAVNVVFLEGASIIENYGETAATTVGLSQAQFNQLSSVTGAFLTNLGFDSEGAANKTIELTERAADMASVFNTDVSSALEAIQSGLKGEFNPLEKFGVKMNAAAIAARAMEMGLAGSESELTDSMKAQAALALIMEQTEKVQGDFLNTSDGLANSQRQLSATFEDIKAKVGGAVLPVLGQLAGMLKDQLARPETMMFIQAFADGIGQLAQNVLTYLPTVITWFQNIFTFLQNNQGIVIGIFAALGVAVTAWAVTTAAAAWTAMAPFLPIIAVLVAIGAAVYLVYQAWTNNWGGIRDTVTNVWNQLQPVFQALKEWLAVAIPAALEWLSNMWNNVLLPALQAVWSFISAYVLPLLSAVGNVIMAVIGNSIKQWAAFITNILIPALSSMWNWIETNILPTLQKFAKWVSEKVSPALKGIGDAIKEVVGWLGDLASKINNLSLPEWLTPGSPTPWELGLRGVGSAMKQLARDEMPAFSAGLQMSAVGVGAGGGAGGGMVLNINVTSDGITDEKDVARKIGSAVEVILRERGLA